MSSVVGSYTRCSWVASNHKILEFARCVTARSVDSLVTASFREIVRRIDEFEQAGAARAVCEEKLRKLFSTEPLAGFGPDQRRPRR